MSRKVINWIVTVIIISVLFYLFFVMLTGTGEVFGAAEGLELLFIPVILGLVFLAYLLRGFRWNYYLGQIGLRINRGEGLWLFFSGLSMLITPMMISGAIKVGLVKARHGEPISSSFPIVIVERLTDLIGMLVLIMISGFAMVLFEGNLYYMGIVLFVVCFLAVFIGIMRSKTLCRRGLAWLGRGRLRKKLQEPLENAYGTIYRLLGPRPLLTASCIAVVSWTLQGLSFYAVLVGLGMDMGLLDAIFIFAFTTVLGIISQLPGGIGAEEGGMLAMMLLAGQETGISVAAILLYRIMSLWFGLLMGVVALKYYTAKYIGRDVSLDGTAESGGAGGEDP